MERCGQLLALGWRMCKGSETLVVLLLWSSGRDCYLLFKSGCVLICDLATGAAALHAAQAEGECCHRAVV